MADVIQAQNLETWCSKDVTARYSRKWNILLSGLKIMLVKGHAKALRICRSYRYDTSDSVSVALDKTDGSGGRLGS